MSYPLSKLLRPILALLCSVLGTASAGTASLTISATVLSKSACKFNAPTANTISFGALDPSVATLQTASSTFSFTCNGSAAVAAYTISQDGGLYASSGNRMRHATLPSEYLPYNVSLSSTTGSAPKNVPQPLTVTVNIPSASVSQAAPGAFSDDIVLTISP